jgi:putative membrane protein
MKRICALLVSFLPGAVAAHTISSEPESSGAAELGVVIPLLLAAVLYAMGVFRLWNQAGANRGIKVGQVAAFIAGWFTLVCALLSPLDRLGAELFAFHMIQHEVLMLVAAPLLVAGRPLAVFLWAFPQRVRPSIGKLTQARGFSRTWRGLTQPLTAWSLHALTLWVWHAPVLFNAVLVNRAVHDLQHITFLGSALLFWSALLGARAKEMQGAAILYLFTTTVHCSVLGALITFGTREWYPHYSETAPAWGLTALEDQQLGGLIMWVPASLIYVGIALYLLARWILAAEPVRSRS